MTSATSESSVAAPPNWKPNGYLERLPKDPWGHPYQYLSPGLRGEIDVYTLGADGQPGGTGIDAEIARLVVEAVNLETPAEAIDPRTDIAGLHVTASVGLLPEEKKIQAVHHAIRRAEKLIDDKIILGAFVACQGRTAMTRFIAERLRTT